MLEQKSFGNVTENQVYQMSVEIATTASKILILNQSSVL